MTPANATRLSRRERQILEILIRHGRATAAEVREDMADRPSYSAVRSQLRTLEEKGHIRHKAEELRYVYMPAAPPSRIRRNAVRHLVDTFFGGSAARAAAALLSGKSAQLSRQDLDELARLIDKARTEGR